MNNDDANDSSEQQRSHADRIREEVNRLLPDISFDDEDDETYSNDENLEPIEIFSRGHYMNDIDVYDLEDESDSQNLEISESQHTEIPNEPNVGIEEEDQSQMERGISTNAFENVAAELFQPQSGGSSLESLMKAAISQLMTSDQLVAPASGQTEKFDSPKPETSAAGDSETEASTKRVSFDEASNRVHSIDNERSITSARRGHSGRLFCGLSGNKYEEARNRYLPEDNVSLNFGVRGDVNLDELLNSMETPNVEITHYLDVEDNDQKEEKNLALLKRLETMSRQYSRIGSSSYSPSNTSANETRSSSSSRSDFSPRSSASQSSSKSDFCDSTDDVHKRVYIDFVPRSKANSGGVAASSSSQSTASGVSTCNMGTSTSTSGTSTSDVNASSWSDIAPDLGRGNQSSTVFLDLRNASPNVSNGESNSSRLQPPVVSSSESESSEDEESDGLWLDRHRRARTAGPDKPSPKPEPVVEQPIPKENVDCSAVKEEVAEKEVVDNPSPATITVTSSGCQDSSDDSKDVSDRVKRKIEEIKKREEELGVRRRWGHILSDILERNGKVNERIFHEEFSFSSGIPVLPSNLTATICTLRFELRSPGELITLGKLSRPVDDGRGVPVCHSALLTWLLSLTVRSSPFRVVGLQQSVRGQRLVTHVAVTAAQPHVQRFLNGCSLRDVLPKDWLHQLHDSTVLSSVSLSQFVSIQAGWDWRADGCFMASSLTSTERIPGWKCSDTTETGVVTLHGDTLSHGGRLMALFLATQRSGLDLTGVRLLHPSEEPPVLALAWRGFGCLQQLREICGPGPRAVLSGAPRWELTRFPEAVSPALARYFGARIISTSQASEQVVQTMLRRQQHLLTVIEPSDLLLLLSPAVPDISWLLHTALERGLDIVGARRLRVDKKCADEEFGMSPAQIAVYSSGVSHLLILRQGNAMGHAAAFVQEAYEKLYAGQAQKSTMPHSSLLFYAMPCLPSLLSCFGDAEMYETPAVSNLTMEDISFSDEKYVFLTIHGADFRRLLVEILDQITNFEVLGIKCVPAVSSHHLKLLNDSFGKRVNVENGIVCLLLRGIDVIEALQDAVKHASGNILISRSLRQAVRLARSFFFEWELIPEVRRRVLGTMLPQQFLSSERNIFDEMVTPLPEMKTTLTVSFSGDFETSWALCKICKTLENEKFIIEDIRLSREEGIRFILRRVNVVYRLLQCVHTKLRPIFLSSDIKVPSTATDAETVTNEIGNCRVISEIPEVNSPLLQHLTGILNQAHDDYQELGLIMITHVAFQRSGRSKSTGVHVLEMISNKKFSILGCQTLFLDDTAARQINALDIISMEDDPKAKLPAGKLICLLVQGIMACMGIRQMLKSNQTIQKMGSSVFTPQSQSDVLKISSSLLNCVTVQ